MSLSESDGVFESQWYKVRCRAGRGLRAAAHRRRATQRAWRRFGLGWGGCGL